MKAKSVALCALLSVGLLLGAGVDVARAQRQCQANQFAKLLPSDGAAGDYFGYVHVAIDGDTAVIGACNDDASGSAYVFQYDGVSWVQAAKLTASDGAPGDSFGREMAVSGDTAVIGAHRGDGNKTDSGSAYVFEKPPGGWVDMTETAELTASDGAALDDFGIDVGISGDIIVVGACRDYDKAYNSGSAYIFEKPPGGWVDMNETAKLLPSDGGVAQLFGAYLAISADTAVIGTPCDNDKGYRSGSAYVFQEPPGGWVNMTETAKLTASDGAAYDYLGRGVAVWGDTAVIGADGDDNVKGSAYVFQEPPGGWVSMTETAKLTASDGAANDQFGSGVGICGDIAVIGAWGDDSYSGSAYVFQKPAGGWVNMTETAKLIASDGAPGDYFGVGAAVSGDTAVFGAFGDDDNGQLSGSAYVFRGLSDCNNNGTLDICDIATGTSEDNNANGIPDECENQPPVITCNGPVVLWPPNHELVDVSSAFSVGDPDADPVTLSFRVLSDEPEIPETGDGTGKHAPDFKDEHNGGRGLLVRSERRGREDGRYYIFVITADDGNGGVTTGVCVAAVVPHDQDPQSLDDVIAQAEAAASVVQDAVDMGEPLPPAGLHEHGLADPLGPKQ